jgi:predicted O-linked N-acetylglucosamine transferase (SPINDLY family)
MSAKSYFADSVNWQEQAQQYLVKGQYNKAASLYEQATTVEPEVKSHYWHLGLLYLLQGQEAEAQTTWLLGIAQAELEEVDVWTAELVQILEAEAKRQQEQADYQVAWAIRQHIRELNPSDINNLLQLIELSIQLETLTGEDLTSLEVIELLQSEPRIELNPDVLLQVLRSLLKFLPFAPQTLEFAEACLPHAADRFQEFIDVMMLAAVKIHYIMKRPSIAIKVAKFCLQLRADNPEVFRQLAVFYQDMREYDQGIAMAKQCYSLVETLPEKVFATHIVLRGLMSAGGYWEEALAVNKEQQSLLSSLIEEQPMSLDPVTVERLFISTFFLPYFQDCPKQNRYIQNQIGLLCQANMQIYARDQLERYQQRKPLQRAGDTPTKPLKIGYLSHCMKRHSVGWLARWLFQYHNRERFEIHGYFIGYSPNVEDSLRRWYIEHVDQAHTFEANIFEIAEQIYQDEIDILVELDSITLDINCGLLPLKPAPVQVSWLGWDASGMPAIDYFITDSYVLPDEAQDYYTEKIWRLPQTYIAVDGFEVGVPTLRRDQLDIPSDAVVYFSGQRGYKRHADTVHLQMRIIKEVPNSYFLIKGSADEESIKLFFTQIAEEEGVDGDRLRFLPTVPSEAVHRANLGIADVVLDTYPYNGATTTLETLWMCIPLVTRVGEQFAARNSYTMMMNAGITEGIAWTDEEYVEWGVRLGKDAALRQQISWKLRQSRQTAPLWNAKQFTQEMEKAYEQMWSKYLENNNS